jgi:hypothetical protein
MDTFLGFLESHVDPDFAKATNIPVPCGFTEVLAIMVMSESEQMDTFLGFLESHVDPDFAKATNILQFMHDEGS